MNARENFITDDEDLFENGPEARGYEDYIVYVRQILISIMLVSLYYLHLRTNKRTFIRSCLHEMNEKSITQVLDKVSEPILIVKRKHRVSMKPKFINKAAK